MISHSSKSIFVHIPKTGGSSVEEMFFLQGDKRYGQGEKHLKARQVKRLHHKYWDDYLKFTIVRNPWDRIYSLWYNLVATNNTSCGLRTFVDNYIESEVMAHSQLDYLQIDGEIAAQIVYRFEELQEAFSDIIRRFNLDVETIPHAKKREGKPSYKEFYDEATKDKVRHIYADDIKTWKYTFDNS